MSGFTYSIAFDITGKSQVSKAISTTDKLDSSVLGLKDSIGKTEGAFSGMSSSSSTGLGKVGKKAGETGAAFSEMGSSGSTGLGKVGKKATEAGNKLKGFGEKGKSAFSRMRNEAAMLVAQIGLLKFGVDSVKLGAEYQGIDNAIKFASGAEGNKNLKFLDQTVDSLGLNVESATQGFKLWTGGIKGTALEGQKGRDTFWAVSEAVTAMQLSGDQSKGTFLALSQIMSKGKVQAEELRGQLGERIPGALAIAARGMNMTQAELNKMMEDGKLMSEDFLPKFAAELHKTFGGAAILQSQSATANFNRMGTAIFRLKRKVGEELLPVVTAFMTGYLIPAVSWIGENITVLGFFATTFGAVYLAVKGYTIALGVAKVANLLMTGSLWAMNGALWANPIVWVIGTVVGLVAAVGYAWNKFAGFRGFIVGMWSVFQETKRIIEDRLIKPLMGFGKVVIGVLTFNPELISEGLNQTSKALETSYLNTGVRLGKAYSKGYKLGVGDVSQKDPLKDFKSPDALSSAFANNKEANGLKKDDKIKNGISSITGGGKQMKNITINLKNLIEQLTIKSTGITEGANEMEEILVSKLLQVLNTANQAQ